jgi:hypothetical protein
MEAIDNRIFQEIREHNQVMENLEYLSDGIGPRLTGSDQLQKAVNWVFRSRPSLWIRERPCRRLESRSLLATRFCARSNLQAGSAEPHDCIGGLVPRNGRRGAR